MEGISVIVCCYNSQANLPITLKHLAEQDFAGNWQLIIVDNNSTDGTSKFAQSEWAKYNLQNVEFSLIFEPLPGQLNARRTGCAHAFYEYIVFCDDDNWLAPDYLSNVNTIFKTNPETYIGGSAEAVFENDATVPAWFATSTHGYAVGYPFKENGIQEAIYIWGAGMAVKKSAMKKVFDPAFPFLLNGRAGGSIFSGDDSEICVRLYMAGYKLYYCRELKLKHFIPAKKLTDEYKDKLFGGFNKAGGIMNSYAAVVTLSQLKFSSGINLFLKELYRFIYPRYTDRRVQASRYLYFFTGLNMFGNEHDHFVKKYWRHLKNSK